jgi:hypothetical protein
MVINYIMFRPYASFEAKGTTMFHNRITRYMRGPSLVGFFQTKMSQATVAPSSGRPTSVVMVPCATNQVAWQAQLYRLAYERAVAQLAPPRHLRRFFSVWN